MRRQNIRKDREKIESEFFTPSHRNGINSDVRTGINRDKSSGGFKRPNLNDIKPKRAGSFLVDETKTQKVSKKPKSSFTRFLESVGENLRLFKNFRITFIIVILIGIFIVVFSKRLEANHLVDANRMAEFKNATYSEKLKINNKDVKLSHPYKVRKGVVHAPIMDFIKLFKLKGSYSLAKNNKVVLLCGNKEYHFTVGSGEVVMPLENNKKIHLNGSCELIDSTLYVPMDFILKVMDVNIHRTSEGITYIDNFPEKFDYSWTKNNKYIAHALGGINEDYYTNSLEALEYNYKRGLRVFEADLSPLEGGDFALIHTFSKDNLNELGLPESWHKDRPTAKEFKSRDIMGKYTSMTFRDLVEYMSEHKDVWIVLDMKVGKREEMHESFTEIVKIAKSVDPKVLDRLIPQIYYEDMYKTIMEVYPWKSAIYTMYKLEHFTEESITNYAYAHGIKVVASYRNRFTDSFVKKLRERGIMLYMYTYNDPARANRLFERGVYGIYTDFLPGNEKGYGPN